MFLRLSFAVHFLENPQSLDSSSSWKWGNLLKTTCKQAEANGKSERLRNNERSCSCMKMEIVSSPTESRALGEQLEDWETSGKSKRLIIAHLCGQAS